jgi:hypothetical protein
MQAKAFNISSINHQFLTEISTFLTDLKNLHSFTSVCDLKPLALKAQLPFFS